MATVRAEWYRTHVMAEEITASPIDTDFWLGRIDYVHERYPLAESLTIPLDILQSALTELAALRVRGA